MSAPDPQERAEWVEKIGTARKRQVQAFLAVYDAGRSGATQAEVGDHGWASGALTALHKGGVLVRTTDRRNNQEIYLFPRFAGDRPLVPYRPNKPKTAPPPFEARTVYLPAKQPNMTALAAAERVAARARGAANSQFRDDLLLVVADYRRLAKP